MIDELRVKWFGNDLRRSPSRPSSPRAHRALRTHRGAERELAARAHQVVRAARREARRVPAEVASSKTSTRTARRARRTPSRAPRRRAPLPALTIPRPPAKAAHRGREDRQIEARRCRHPRRAGCTTSASHRRARRPSCRGRACRDRRARCRARPGENSRFEILRSPWQWRRGASGSGGSASVAASMSCPSSRASSSAVASSARSSRGARRCRARRRG